MIEFENYERVAADYARIRQPVGLSVLIGAFSDCGQQGEPKRLIDIGCGAAVYAAELSRYFSSVFGIDRSAQQIVEGQRRLSSGGMSNVSIEVGDARRIECGDGVFHAALISLMLHHVRSEDGNHFSEQSKVVSEAARVLKHGGVLVTVVCTERQIRDGAWYCSLVPSRILDMYCDFSPKVDRLIETAAHYGLTLEGRYLQTDRILQGDGYFDEEGPTKASWRNADSLWSLLSKDELSDVIARTESMRQSGDLGRYIQDHTSRLKEFGQATFLVFRKGTQA